MKTDMTGRVALITGAGGGIGRALTKRFHEMGMRLALVGRSEDKLIAAAEDAGCQDALILSGDLTDPEFLTGVADTVYNHFADLDVLVNNAGVCFVKPMEETTYEELDLIMKTNVYAPYMLCKCAVPILRLSDCPTIINMGSVVSHKGYPAQSAYSTAKHALLGMTRALAAEVYRDGIRVHILCPGAVHTRMAETVSRPDIDMNALIETEDIADAAEYLLTHRGNAVIDEIQMHRVGKQPF